MSELSDHEKRLKKLTFRSGHRGIRELDILVSGFAEINLENMSEDELDQFEALLHVPDQEFYAILREEREIPPSIDLPVLHRMIAHTQKNKDI